MENIKFTSPNFLQAYTGRVRFSRPQRLPTFFFGRHSLSPSRSINRLSFEITPQPSYKEHSAAGDWLRAHCLHTKANEIGKTVRSLNLVPSAEAQT